MFGFFKRRKSVTLELDSATIGAMFDEIVSPAEREYVRVSEHAGGLSEV